MIQELKRRAEEGDTLAVLKLEAALDRLDGGKPRFYLLKRSGERPVGGVLAILSMIEGTNPDGSLRQKELSTWAVPVRSLEGLFAEIVNSTFVYDSALGRLYTASLTRRMDVRIVRD